MNQQNANGTPKMVETAIPGLTGLFISTAGWDAEKYNSTMQFTDINSDGRPDLCARAAESMVCYQNNGSSFSQVTLGSFITLSDTAGFNDPSYYKTFRFFTMPNGRMAFFTRINTGSTINYMGSLTPSEPQALDLITAIKAGSAPQIDITYQNGALDTTLHVKGNQQISKITSPDYTGIDLPAAMSLVSEVSVTDPATNTNSYTLYTYKGLAAQFRRGLLGFRSIRSQAYPAGTWSTTTYHQDWPLIGMMNNVKGGYTNRADSSPLSESSYDYGMVDLTSLPNAGNTANTRYDTSRSVTSGCNNGNAVIPTSIWNQLPQSRYFIYPNKVVERTRSAIDPSRIMNEVTTHTVMDILQSNAQGNTPCISVKTDAYNPVLGYYETFQKVTNNIFDYDPKWTSNGSLSGYWILGRLTQSIVTAQASNSTKNFVKVPVLGTSQGGYAVQGFNLNNGGVNFGPVYPSIMPWFVPLMSLSLN